MESLRSIASKVKARGLAAPAIFFLEMHKPLATLGALSIMAAAPLLQLLWGHQEIKTATAVLSSRESIEALISLLEGRA